MQGGKDERLKKQKEFGEVYTPNSIIAEMNTNIQLEGVYMEACCGLAPFLNNRYDQITGKINPIQDRNGIFDIKMRMLDIQSEDVFYEQVVKILKTLYGFEYDREVVLLSRRAMMDAILDYETYYLGDNKKMPLNIFDDISDILSWNLFNMDIFTNCIPQTKTVVYIMDWEANKKIQYRNIKPLNSNTTLVFEGFDEC